MKKGFTLAEVLITLVIIGVIAAMTIPTLMNKTNEQETVTAVKKAYSVLGQAYKSMFADYGEINPADFGSTRIEATKNFGDVFVKYLSVQKKCGIETGGDCWSSENQGVYHFFNGSYWNNFNLNSGQYYLARLNDGSSFFLNGFYEYKTVGTTESFKYVIGQVFIDINGDKGPNTNGKDVFSFWITKNGVFPVGTVYDTNYPFSTCKNRGEGCTAWVIAKGNMDYLRKDVSW